MSARTAKLFKTFKLLYGKLWTSNFEDQREANLALNLWDISLALFTDKQITTVLNDLLKGKYEAYLTFPPLLTQFRALIDRKDLSFFVCAEQAYKMASSPDFIPNVCVRYATAKIGRYRLLNCLTIEVEEEFKTRYTKWTQKVMERYGIDELLSISERFRNTSLEEMEMWHLKRDPNDLSCLMAKWRKRKIEETWKDPLTFSQAEIENSKKKFHDFVTQAR